MKREKKNYLVGLLVSLGWWSLLGGVVILINPEKIADWILPQGYLPFMFLLFMAVFFSGSLILMSSRRGLLMALGVMIIVYLRIWRISNWINVSLLVGVLIAIELYFWGKGDTTASNNADFE